MPEYEKPIQLCSCSNISELGVKIYALCKKEDYDSADNMCSKVKSIIKTINSINKQCGQKEPAAFELNARDQINLAGNYLKNTAEEIGSEFVSKNTFHIQELNGTVLNITIGVTHTSSGDKYTVYSEPEHLQEHLNKIQKFDNEIEHNKNTAKLQNENLLDIIDEKITETIKDSIDDYMDSDEIDSFNKFFKKITTELRENTNINYNDCFKDNLLKWFLVEQQSTNNPKYILVNAFKSYMNHNQQIKTAFKNMDSEIQKNIGELKNEKKQMSFVRKFFEKILVALNIKHSIGNKAKKDSQASRKLIFSSFKKDEVLNNEETISNKPSKPTSDI